MKVGILLADGFEEIEALGVLDVLRRANISAYLVSTTKNDIVTSSHNTRVICDILLSKTLENFDMIILPGGLPGATNLRDNAEVISLIKYFDQNKKKIGAICAAPIVLEAALDLTNRHITSYPGYSFKNFIYEEENVVVCDNLITSRGPALTLEFAYKILEFLGVDNSSIKEGMLYHLREK